MTKQEVIEKAYGECWNAVKQWVDENGWFNYATAQFHLSLFFGTTDYDEITDGYNLEYKQRPKSLDGINNNNGWTKIESNDDLPTKQGKYFGYKDGKISFVTYIENTLSDVRKEEFKEDCTHWMLIKAPQGPKY